MRPEVGVDTGVCEDVSALAPSVDAGGAREKPGGVGGANPGGTGESLPVPDPEETPCDAKPPPEEAIVADEPTAEFVDATEPPDELLPRVADVGEPCADAVPPDAAERGFAADVPVDGGPALPAAAIDPPLDPRFDDGPLRLDPLGEVALRPFEPSACWTSRPSKKPSRGCDGDSCRSRSTSARALL